jgi:hypothetical protein
MNLLLRSLFLWETKEFIGTRNRKKKNEEVVLSWAAALYFVFVVW